MAEISGEFYLLTCRFVYPETMHRAIQKLPSVLVIPFLVLDTVPIHLAMCELTGVGYGIILQNAVTIFDLLCEFTGVADSRIDVDHAQAELVALKLPFESLLRASVP